MSACIVVALGGDFSPTSAQISPENYQNFFQVANQQAETEVQALESEQEGQEPQTLENEQEGQQEEQNLERKDEELDREMQIEQKNPGEPNVEEVPGPGEELGVDGLDDNTPVQPPDEEIEMKF
jgi:hypothetical protein